MAFYQYVCSNCETNFEYSLIIANRNLPVEMPCPECSTANSIVRSFEGDTVAIGDPVKLGIRKIPKYFKDRIKQIKEAHPQPKGYFR